MQKQKKRSLILLNQEQISKQLELNKCDDDMPSPKQYRYLPPRTFPHPKVPNKVHIKRVSQQYNSVDLNSYLKNIDWSQKGELSLKNFCFCSNWVIEYGCRLQDINQGKVIGRAYCPITSNYEHFVVTGPPIQSCPSFSFAGKYLLPNDKQIKAENVHREKICFSFQDPELYITQILQAVKRRSKVMKILKYEFYVDCIDDDQRIVIDRKILHRIKELSMLYIKQQSDVHMSFTDFQLITQHYRRVMNELMFRNMVKIDELQIYIPTKYQKPKPQTKISNKIKIKKDNKIIVIVPKSINERIQTFTHKFLCANKNVTEIMVFLNLKLSLLPKTLFLDLKNTHFQKYMSKQQNCLTNAFSLFNEMVIEPLSSQFRHRLATDPDGWFRVHLDLQMYLQSKLKSVFRNIECQIRDRVVQWLTLVFQHYSSILGTYQQQPQLNSKINAHCNNKDSNGQKNCLRIKEREKQASIRIPLVLSKNQLKLSVSSSKILLSLKKLIHETVQKMSRVPSAEQIVLYEIYGGYKNQQSIHINLPIINEFYQAQTGQQGQSDGIFYAGNRFPKGEQSREQKDLDFYSKNYVRYHQLEMQITRIFNHFHRLCQTLSIYENQSLAKLNQQLDIKKFMEQKKKQEMSVQEIRDRLHKINYLQEINTNMFKSKGQNIGFFYIDFQNVQKDVENMLEKEKQQIFKGVLFSIRILNNVIGQEMKTTSNQIYAKPRNVDELIEKQNLVNDVKQNSANNSNRKKLRQYRQICDNFGCRVDQHELKKQIQNDKIIIGIYSQLPKIEEQLENMCIAEAQILKAQKQQIKEALNDLAINKEQIKNYSKPANEQKHQNVAHWEHLAKMVSHLKSKYNECLHLTQQYTQKQKHLGCVQSFPELFFKIKQEQNDLQPYEILYSQIYNWKNLQSTWLNSQVSDIKLQQFSTSQKQKQDEKDEQNGSQFERIINILIRGFKKCSSVFETRNLSSHQLCSKQFLKQIEQFLPKLSLLKLLQKKGLTKQLLAEVGIILEKEPSQLTLAEALSLNLLEKTYQIEAVSNNAYNKFSLEQILARLLTQIYQLKLKIKSYKDKKSNDILIIQNHEQLTAEIEQIAKNCEALNFNPMVKDYEVQVNNIYEKIEYISKSIILSKKFQNLLVELHPIFDSTDIIKQIPKQNKIFSKILRMWLEISKYCEAVESVHDACYGQNMLEKLKSMLTQLEKVQQQLIEYLQQKRKGFSRFYLLSNTEMFELFSATSDINSVNKLIPKLFDSVISLQISKTQIEGLVSDLNCNLKLQRSITHQGTNIEVWLSSLQKQIIFTIFQKIKRIYIQKFLQQGQQISGSTTNKKESIWMEIIQQPTMIPQICYLLYEIYSTQGLEKNIKSSERIMNFKKVQEKILKILIQRKRQWKSFQMTQKSNIMLCSMIILVSSKIQILDRFYRNKICSTQNFQFKKLLKSKFTTEEDLSSQQIVIDCMDQQNKYGCNFLGLFTRLVITNLTERMQALYFLAQKHSLGISAIGPAGTGKTQTTKEIARIVGKNCLVYNCAQDFAENTFIRLIKGLAITGLWMCFDQFNRLDLRILSMAAEQLSYLLKVRSYQHKIEVPFLGSLIWINPEFQFCVTCNPTYKSREQIPEAYSKILRTVSVFVPDSVIICQALLFSNGYEQRQGIEISKKIINILRNAETTWNHNVNGTGKNQKFDFGLRMLRSVIEYSSKLLLNGQYNEENSVIEALKVLNLPKMKQQDRQLFVQMIESQFKTILPPIQKSLTDVRLQNFEKIVKIRNGTLVCGEALSCKSTMLYKFKQNHKQADAKCQCKSKCHQMCVCEENNCTYPCENVWDLITIFHDALTISQIFGRLDPKTKLWTDGFFTSAVRSYVNQNKRKNFAIVMNGSVFSQWIQNLNSFLDVTRKMSLASGETISIPPTLKLIVSCSDLSQASPATITRFGLVSHQSLKNALILQKLEKQGQKFLVFFESVQAILESHFLIKIQSRFILNWLVSHVPVKSNSTILTWYLAQIYEGILSQRGKKIFEKQCARFLHTSVPIFKSIMSQKDIISLTSVFQSHRKYQQSQQAYQQRPIKRFQDIFIETENTYRFGIILQKYMAHWENNKQLKIFTIFGDSDAGKSRVCLKYLSENSSTKNSKIVKIFFSTKTTSYSLLKEISRPLTQKAPSTMGAVPGQRVNIWIENMNLPMNNKFSVYPTAQTLRMICEQNAWYNHKSNKKEFVQNIHIFCDANTQHFKYKNPLNIDSRFYRHLVPIFYSSTSEKELSYIFKSILVNNLSYSKNGRYCFSNQTIEKIFEIVQISIKMFFTFKEEKVFSDNIVPFCLNDLYKLLKGLLSWKIPNQISKIAELFQYELSISIFSKIPKRKQNKQFYEIIKKFIKMQGQMFPLFHNFEHSNISKQKCQKVESLQDFTNRFQYICDEYRALNKQETTIIVFPDLIDYILKLSKILEQQNNHCIIIGNPKCGKNTLVKLSSYILSYDLFNPPQNYEENIEVSLEKDLKKAWKDTYKNKNPSILTIRSQVFQSEECIEVINKLLLTMDIFHLYSEVQLEELSFMIQSQLLKKSLEVNTQNVWKYFVNFVKYNFHSVFIMNANSLNVGILKSVPCLLKCCHLMYIDKWPQEALYLIAKLEISFIDYQIRVLPKIYESIAHICEKSPQALFGSLWEGMYFDFVTILKRMLENNQKLLSGHRDQYLKSQNLIKETENQLILTKSKIKSLQPAIILTENETSKTVKNLEIQRKNAEQSNKILEIKNMQAEIIVKESLKIKSNLQAKIKIVDQELMKAWENVSLIKTAHIAEIKVLSNPSELIKTVLAGLVILLHNGPLIKEAKEVNGTVTFEQSYFETAKKNILNKDSKSLCKILMEFKRENVSEEMFITLEKKCLSHKRWNQKQAKNANKAIYYFFIWVQAVANQYRIYQQTKPLRQQLQKTNKLLSRKENEIKAIKKQLQLYNNKIFEYESLHKLKKQALEEYRFQIKTYETLVNRGNELLKQISGQKSKWQNYISQIETKLKNNFGDSIIMASVVSFLSPHIYEIRKEAKQLIYQICQQNAISCSFGSQHNNEVAWYLTKEQKQTFQLLHIHQNQFLIDNLKVQELTSKIVLLVDPQNEGFKLIKQLNWQKNQIPIDKISQFSPNLKKCIESAVLYGRIVFVEVDPKFFNKQLNFVLNPVITRNSKQQRELKSGQKTIPLHDNFKIYFHTTQSLQKERKENNGVSREMTESSTLCKQFLTQTQIINFKLTRRQLQQKILDSIINQEHPLLKSRIEELKRINIKDTIMLNSVEEKLLKVFSGEISALEMLQSDDVISTVVQSNRLYRQIQARGKESAQQSEQIEKEKIPYLKNSQKICQIYNRMGALAVIDELYSFSYHWFLELFENNIHTFTQNLYQELARCFCPEQRIILSIILAEIIYSELPWHCLFENSENEQMNLSSGTQRAELELGKDALVQPKDLPVENKQLKNVTQMHKRVIKVGKYIPNFEQKFSKNSQIFSPVLMAKESQILQSIPDQFSNLDYFYRILLISCFRPELVTTLLRQWISINLGNEVVDPEPICELLKNTRPTRPIITIMHQTPIQSYEKIKEIYLKSRKQKNILITNHRFNPNSMKNNQFDNVVKQCIIENGWLIVEEALTIDATTFIQQYFQSVVIQADKQFRVFILIPCEIKIATVNKRFVQFCDKIRLNPLKNLYKEISQSFQKYQDYSKKQLDLFERGKKKLTISQLCIFHHLFSEYINRQNEERTKNKIIPFTDCDLRLTVQEMNSYKIDQESKRILHSQIICRLTYGSQLSNYYLQKFLSISSGTIINDIVTERSQFFETFWGDEKFPKNAQEYQHQIRSRISRFSYDQMFGMDHKMQLKLKNKQYAMICRFYQNANFFESTNKQQIVVKRLKIFARQLTELKLSSVKKKVEQELKDLKIICSTSSKLPIYHFYRIQFESLLNLIEQILSDIDKCQLCIKQKKEVRNNVWLEKIMLNTYKNISHWPEGNTRLTLSQFGEKISHDLITLEKQIIEHRLIGNVTDLSSVSNLQLWFQTFMSVTHGNPQENIHKQHGKMKDILVFVAYNEKVNLLDELSKYGIQIQEEPQQIKNQQGQKKQENEIKSESVKNEQAKNIIQQNQQAQRRKDLSFLKTEKAQQKGIKNHMFIKGLTVKNCQTIQKNSQILLKIDGKKRDQDENVLVQKKLLQLGQKKQKNLSKSMENHQQIHQNESQLSGILFIYEKAFVEIPQKKNSKNKNYTIFQSQTKVLIQLPLQLPFAIDPIIVNCLNVRKQTSEIQSEIIKKNIHLSIKV